jgi:hypothetical protein
VKTLALVKLANIVSANPLKALDQKEIDFLQKCWLMISNRKLRKSNSTRMLDNEITAETKISGQYIKCPELR